VYVAVLTFCSANKPYDNADENDDLYN
jgi:hypothetical protein